MEPNIDRDVKLDNVHNLYTDRTVYTDRVSPETDRDSWRYMIENLYTDMTRLWAKESELIRVEMNEKITEVKAATGSLVAGSTILFVGVIAAAATAIIALSYVIEVWAAALIVTAVLFIVGGIMVSAAKKKLAGDRLKPTKSVQAFNEITSTFKEKVYEFKKH